MARLALKLAYLCIVLHCISGSLQTPEGIDSTESRTENIPLIADMKVACIRAATERFAAADPNSILKKLDDPKAVIYAIEVTIKLTL